MKNENWNEHPFYMFLKKPKCTFCNGTGYKEVIDSSIFCTCKIGKEIAKRRVQDYKESEAAR